MCPSQFLLTFLLLSLVHLFLLQPFFHFPRRFLLLNFLEPHSTLNSYVVTLVRDPLVYCRWVLCTFITCKLSCHQAFGSWRIVAYHLTSKWALLSFSSFTSVALLNPVLGLLGCLPIRGQRCLVVWTSNFHQTVPTHSRTWFLLSGLLLAQMVMGSLLFVSSYHSISPLHTDDR